MYVVRRVEHFWKFMPWSTIAIWQYGRSRDLYVELVLCGRLTITGAHKRCKAQRSVTLRI